MELDRPDFEFTPPADRRATIPEPPPVRLVAVEDVTLPAEAGEAAKLDAFYVGLLRFERDEKADGLVYRAENARLRFELSDGPVIHDDMRAVGIDVPSLRDLELKFVEQEIVFAKERGMTVGQLTFLLQDPAGHWIRIGEVSRIL